MATKGNRGFGELIAGEGAAAAVSRLPPRTGILQARENRLASLACGSSVARMQELVDPARCRIWDGHNRDYASLDETTCADLIDSLRAQGRQEIPAVVRRVSGEAKVEYEVVCGARRHWSVSWLRAHGHPEFRFLVEPREMTDEEAFRVADLENRSRKDLSDHERAADYARALGRHYNGNQGRMAERLQVSQSWLSRYLDLARLPPAVVAAFGTPHALRISHAARLAPLLRAPATRGAVMAAAGDTAAAQEERRSLGKALIPAVEVARRLATPPRPATRKSGRLEHRDGEGRVVAWAQKGRGGAITVTLPGAGKHEEAELVGAVTDLVRRLRG